MADQNAWFDEDHYLKSKLNQLQRTEPEAGWTLDTLRDAISNAGLTSFSHFQAYGLQERTSPNPSFNAYEYLQAKLKQLQKDQDGNYTSIEQVADAIAAAGMDLWGHFQEYGWKEGVNPSNAFDINGYFESKLAELQNADPQGGWDLDKVKEEFANAGLDPVSHYAAYGKDEPGVEPVEVPVDDRVPADPNPVEPEPEPGPEPDPGPTPPVLFHLATLKDGELSIVNGTEGDDIFSGDSSATVRGGTLVDGKPVAGLVLDGKGGNNLLSATLNAPIHHPSYSPTVSNVQTISLHAKGETDNIGMMFTRVSDLKTLQNSGSTANLTATDIRNKVTLTIDDMSAGGARDFAVRYGQNVEPIGTQLLYLRDSHVNLLTITKLKWDDGTGYISQSAGIRTLDIHANGLSSSSGNNAIASFDEKLGEGGGTGVKGDSIGAASLAASLREINVWGEGSLSLNLAELKTLAKKDGVGPIERIETDLTEFNIGTGHLVKIKVADLANGDSGSKTDLGDGKTGGNPKSNQTIELGKDLDGGSQLIIENMTIASTTGYTHIPVRNDILVLTDWNIPAMSGDGSNAEKLASLITTFTVSTGAKLSDSLNYIDFKIGFQVNDGDPESGFTLTLTNLVSENVYNKMLQAIDTVNGSDKLNDTRDLVGSDVTWVADGSVHSAFNTNKFDDSIALSGEHGTAAIIGLTGILVNEGTFVLADIG